METDYPHELDWTATLRRRDTNKDYRVNVSGVDILSAAASAKIKADDRFSIVVCLEVLE